jgi:hypothetical protein
MAMPFAPAIRKRSRRLVLYPTISLDIDGIFSLKVLPESFTSSPESLPPVCLNRLAIHGAVTNRLYKRQLFLKNRFFLQVEDIHG